MPTQLTLPANPNHVNCVLTFFPTQLAYDLGMAEIGSRRIARARARYDRAYAALIGTIREELAAKAVTVTEAADQAKWSREYIGQIRDGKAGDDPPKRRVN